MQFSFVIPSYQQGSFIKNCLDSIQAQRLPINSYEVWVIDGGSTDETSNVVKSHPLHPNFISEPDRGQAHAVNKGISCSKGEYIAWINSDDYYRLGAFKLIREYLYKDTKRQKHIIYGDGDIVDRNGNLICRYPTEDWNWSRLAERCIFCQPSTIFSRKAYEEAGPLNEDLHLTLDLEYWLRLGKLFKPERLPLTIACSRHYESTKSSTKQLQMQIEAALIGHREIGGWSSRRLWSVVENKLIIERPHYKKVLQPNSGLSLQYLAFWLIKTMRYYSLRRKTKDKLLQLLKDYPSR